MVVEEPSVVAAVSNVARLARPEGFVACSGAPPHSSSYPANPPASDLSVWARVCCYGAGQY
eukprot:561865-Rhodomonas_salina.5